MTRPLLLALALAACKRDPAPDCTIDGSSGGQAQAWFVDNDEDGYGDGATWQLACDAPDGWVDNGDDCDDDDDATFPGAAETCDARDNDCDVQVDEDAQIAFTLDRDGDGFGDGAPFFACVAPEGYAAQDGDCDDTRDDVFPGATELCDGVDSDCDPSTADPITRTCYPDADGDSYGDGAVAIPSCAAACPPGQTEDTTDCDDADDDAFPGAPELCDGVDNDCDAATFIDEGATCTTGADPVLNPANGHTYLPATYEDSWGGAHGVCGARGYHLVWIDDAAEAAWVEALIEGLGATGPSWIGVSYNGCGSSATTFQRVDPRPNPDTCAPVSAWESAALVGAPSSGAVALDAGALAAVSTGSNFFWYVCEVEP
jgi:hypothetical protein